MKIITCSTVFSQPEQSIFPPFCIMETTFNGPSVTNAQAGWFLSSCRLNVQLEGSNMAKKGLSKVLRGSQKFISCRMSDSSPVWSSLTGRRTQKGK